MTMPQRFSYTCDAEHAFGIHRGQIRIALAFTPEDARLIVGALNALLAHDGEVDPNEIVGDLPPDTSGGAVTPADLIEAAGHGHGRR
jgi:hypothetical protein